MVRRKAPAEHRSRIFWEVEPPASLPNGKSVASRLRLGTPKNSSTLATQRSCCDALPSINNNPDSLIPRFFLRAADVTQLFLAFATLQVTSWRGTWRLCLRLATPE